MKRLILGVLLMILIPAAASAASVKALVDQNQVIIGESIQLGVSISGVKGSVEMPALADFKVIPRGTSTSFQFINGQSSREIIHNYTLIPLKKGKFVIPSIPVKTKEGVLKTEAIALNVLDRPSNAAETRNLFVSAEVSNPQPYEGEQIIYTFKLHNAVRMANVRFKQPDFDGFSAKQIEGTQSSQTLINGRQYEVHQLSFVLVPLRAGETTIHPATLTGDILQRRSRRPRSAFDSLFNDSFFQGMNAKPVVLHSQPVAVIVKALPAPVDELPFSGLVGDFQLHADLENAELMVGDSTTLALTIKGRGNIMDAQAPEIKVPESFKVYEDAPEDNIQVGLSGFSGQKVFRQALVPIQKGRFTLPPIQLSYFNTATRQYETLQTEPLEVSVAPSTIQEPLASYKAPAATPPSFKQQVEFSGRDILPLKEDIEALKSRAPLPFWLLSLLLVIPFFLYAAAISTIRLTRKKTDPASQMAARAQSALSEAQHALTSEAASQTFADSLYRCLKAAIFARAGRQGESLTTSEAKDMLSSQGLAEPIASEAAQMLERLEAAGYGGRDLTQTDRRALLSETKAIIKKLL
jgi:hypothetical protein